MFQTRVLNAIKHYFNDEKGTHTSCLECGFSDCEVVQAQLHNALAILWRVARGKKLAFNAKIMKNIGLFVGYGGTNSALRIGEILDFALVKPKLAVGLWLGERCVDEEQVQGFCSNLKAIYQELASKKTARKVICTNNTQKNEALHGVQSCLYQKDLNHGNSIEMCLQ